MALDNEQDPNLQNAPGTAPASETEETTEDADTEQEAAGLLGGDEEQDQTEGDEEQPEGEFEEIEFDGERYAVPAKLKNAFLMQSDYTRKTQAVAEDQRQIEAARQAVLAEAEALKSESAERGQLANVESQIAQYEKYTPADWQAFWARDPQAHDQHRWNFQNLKEQRQQINDKLANNFRERSETAQREHATRVAKAVSELQRDIKGWGPELVASLTDYGVAQGYTREEITSIADSRAIKVLHKANLYDQLIAKQKTAPRVQANPSATVKPLKQVSKGTSRPATSAVPTDKDTDDAWVKKRRALDQKKRA